MALFSEMMDDAADKDREIARLTDALRTIATQEPASAGSAKPLPFKVWAKLIATNAITAGTQDKHGDSNA